MTERDSVYKQRYAAAYNKLCRRYGKNIEDYRVKDQGHAWFEDLSKFKIEEIEWAFQKLSREGVHFPRLAEVLRVIFGTAKTRAVEEFGRCLEASTKSGDHKSVCFCAVTNAVVRSMCGGWPAFVAELQNVKGRTYLRHAFVEQWSTYAQNGYSVEDKWLPGVHAETNPTLYLAPGDPVPELPLPPVKALPMPEEERRALIESKTKEKALRAGEILRQLKAGTILKDLPLGDGDET